MASKLIEHLIYSASITGRFANDKLTSENLFLRSSLHRANSDLTELQQLLQKQLSANLKAGPSKEANLTEKISELSESNSDLNKKLSDSEAVAG